MEMSIASGEAMGDACFPLCLPGEEVENKDRDDIGRERPDPVRHKEKPLVQRRTSCNEGLMMV